VKTKADNIGRVEIPETVKANGEEYRPWLRRYFAKRTSNRTDVPDRVQEVLVRFLGRRKTTPIRVSKAYLRRTADSVLSRAAKNQLPCVNVSAVDPETLDTALGQLRDEDDGAMVDHDRVLDALPPASRAALLMNCVDGKTHKQIGAELGLSSSQVKRLIWKARERIKRLQSDHPDEAIHDRKQDRRGRPKTVASIATVTLLLSSMGYLLQKTQTVSITTKPGEYRCETLEEGSRICLNTDSQVRYQFTATARNVEILRGEVSFVVQKDRRPFDVLSGSLLVHDVSTAFDIYRKRNSTLVTVIDGRIKVVAPVNIYSRFKFHHAWGMQNEWEVAPEFRRFQRVVFDESTGKLQPEPALGEHRLSQLLAWQRGRIDLNGRTLRDALQELSRYWPDSRFECPPSLEHFAVGGDIEVKNLEGFLEALELEFDIHYTRAVVGGKTVITLLPPLKHDSHSRK